MQPKKSLGQHWLFDKTSLEAMAFAAEVHEGDHVLEVGPGLGTLTKVLLAKGAHVTAVEYDKELAFGLQQNLIHHQGSSFPRRSSTVSSDEPRESSTQGIANGNTEFNWVPDQVGDDTIRNLVVYNEDILTFDLASLPRNYKVCANIPYYLTSNLIRRMLESSNPPSVMALLIQKEVAERVAAEPGEMSILAVATQFYAQATLKELVPAELFTPPPKVDSQIIKIKLREAPLFPDVDTKAFFQIVRAGFSEKRKKLRSSLSGGLQISKPEADELLKASGINPAARAQELTLDEWHMLYKNKAGS